MAPAAQGTPLILACSPRSGGNSDTLAALVHRELPGASLLHLRNYSVLPCISCGYCSSHPGGPCPRETKDSSRELFAAVQEASSLVLVAPVYFCHLPAQFKAFIDRSQPLWTLCDASGGFPPATRTARVILLGGRKTGPRLFEGCMLTLRLWLKIFGFTPPEPLTLYGLDAPGDAAASSEAQEAVIRYVRETAGEE